ncbi:hypothetical protein QUB60_20100 [Microcoleus sp. A2-C5]|uniref:hypothetical protein n=1 Tax=Microcoleaceae TaxID=1892252 RepID=UPI0022379ECA|nr:hypothetical protein [Lyngbya sp. CCAP 1446/10]MCW6050869.1 hypothetical protein [Lyngbya sp. CCAP 1446/10]
MPHSLILRSFVVLTSIAVASLTTYRTTSVAQSPQTAEFYFMVNDKVKPDPRVIKISRHPCGKAALARVTSLPDVDTKGYLSSDKVVEVDPRNNRIQRWAKPVDSAIVAIDGDRILVDADKKLYWIKPSGNFQLQPNQIAAKEPIFESRVKDHPEFKNSGYAGLWRFQDLKTGKTRKIIYEANCT